MKSKFFYKMPEMTAKDVGGFLKVWKHIGLVLLALVFSTNSFAVPNPPPGPIIGPTNLCVGTTIQLIDTPGEGSWSVDNSSIAFVDETGMVLGNTPGNAVISFTTPGGVATTTITVMGNPGTSFVVGGGGSTCSGSSVGITLSPSEAGVIYQLSLSGSPVGTSQTGTGSTLTFNATTPGAYTIIGTNISGCASVMAGSAIVTNNGPTAFGEQGILACGGTTSVFVGANGGTPPYTGIGEFTGVTAGIHQYIVIDTAGCRDTLTLNVTASNTPEISSEGSSVCVGQTLNMGIDASGGTWSTSSGSIAFINGMGVLTGRAAGVVGVTYTLTSGCYSTVQITVNPLASITGGTRTICQGNTMTVTTATPGTGSWYTEDSDIAVASGTANSATIYGTGGGTTVIHYMSDAGCITSRTVTVSPTAELEMASYVCVGQTTTAFASISGGSWTTLNASVVTINSMGLITGVSAGTATIRYMLPTGCYTDMSITVNALSSILPAGTLTLCQGSSMTVTNATPGSSSWYGGSPFVSVMGSGSTAVVTGESAGTTAITFYANGCTTTKSVTVRASAAIEGPASVCVGQTIQLIDTVAGGAWTSTSAAIASVSASGMVTGRVAGTATIKYTLPGGCISNHVVTVNALSATVPTGASTICEGQSLTMTNNTISASSWFSSDPSVATLTYSGGTAVVTGTGGGNTTILFMSDAGCVYTKSITVRSGAPIQGPSSVCVGQTIALSDSVVGGAWSSSAVALAAVNASGVVTGVSAGNVTINYIASGSCIYTKAITVNPLSVITPTGTPSVCIGRSLTLGNTTVGTGVWSSSNTEVATLGTATAPVYTTVWGASAGPAVISYTSAMGCVTTRTVNITDAAPITGLSSVCVGQTITLSNTVAGGTWSSSAVSIASVGVGSGIVRGQSAGTATIIYTLPSGCSYSMVITVNALNVITPTSGAAICAGQSITLANTTPGGGTWSSDNMTVATLTATSSTAVVWGATSGTATISFTSTAGCVTTRTVSVSAGSPIAGLSSVCVGQTITLSNEAPGGVWSSSSAANATVGVASGVVTGAIAGTVNILYTLSGGCGYSKTIVVNPLSIITPTGTPSVCVGRSIVMGNATPGAGVWSSDDVAIATLSSAVPTSASVFGAAAGSTIISYTSAAGCVTTRNLTVTDAAPIIGLTSVCVGQTITLSNTVAGGTWSSSAASIASVGVGSGIVTGKAAGSATIIYTFPSGCSYSMVVTVNALNVITPTSGPAICAGQFIGVANTTPGGGVWSSDNMAVATVMPTSATAALVWGATSGTATISFTSTAGCVTTRTVSVSAGSPIAGLSSVCVGQTITLSNEAPGGAWSSSSAANATVGVASGVVTGAIAGTVNISYTLPGGCSYTKAIVVNPLSIITPTGTPSVCVGRSIVMGNATPGAGVWSSDDVAIATLSSAVPTSASVFGAAAGSTIISYTSAAGCVTTRNLTVTDAAPIIGLTSVCVGQTITLSNTVAGGTWSSSAASIASVGVGSGVVTGKAAGSATIVYTFPSGCSYSMVVTVNGLASIAPGGTPAVCEGRTTTFTNTTPGGGVWMSDAPGNADIFSSTPSSAVIQGIGAGSAVISFTSAAGCTTTRTITVNSTALISGAATICTGETLQLSTSVMGGTWSTSAVAVATVNASGLLTANAGGTVTIVYTLPGGCNSSMTMSINPAATILPAATLQLCQGQFINVTNNVPGGIWASGDGTVATIDVLSPTTARVYGAGAGTTAITYTTAAGCVSTRNVVGAAGPVIIVPSTVCVGQTITLGLGAGPINGTWYSGSGAIATVNASGVVLGRAAGVVTIYNTLPGGCNSSAQVTVLPLSPITGGVNTLCLGNVMLLANSSPGGGVWGTNDNTVADVQSSTASSSVIVATGTGNTDITFTATNGCVATRAIDVVVCKPTDVATTNISNYDVSIFPNPTSGVLTLKGELGVQTDEEVSIQVVDMTGRIILTDATTAKNGVVNKQIALTNGVANGMYILSVRFAGQQKLYHFTVQN